MRLTLVLKSLRKMKLMNVQVPPKIENLSFSLRSIVLRKKYCKICLVHFFLGLFGDLHGFFHIKKLLD